MKEYIFQLSDALYNVETGEAVFQPNVAGELIRCKNCKYRLHLQETSCRPEQYLCRLDERTFYPSRKANNPEWFCADGERRTDETD